MDALDLLLPDATATQRARARTLVTFLRLFADDARAAASPVAVTLGRAEGALDRAGDGGGGALRAALEALAAAHLRVVLGPDSFGDCGPPPAPAPADAWPTVLASAGAGVGAPAPGEAPLDTAARLVAALEPRLPALEADLWRARLVRARDGAAAGEAAFAELASSGDRAVAVRARAGLVASLLDRAAVARAADALAADPGAVESDAELARLDVWVRVLLGDADGARERADRLGPHAGRLPRALVELRAERPDAVLALSGRAPAADDPAPPPAAPPRARGDLGATALCVFAFRPGEDAELAHADVAPALGDPAAWARARAVAAVGADEPEHRALVTMRPVVLHRGAADAPLGGALDPDARAVAVVPVPDADGEAVGWLRLELAHHLVPSRARLAAFARAWSLPLAHRPAAPAIAADAPDEGSATAAALAGWIAASGLGTATRRWSAFAPRGDELTLLAEGGVDLDRAGVGRALARAVATGGAVRWSEPDHRLALAVDARSGLALPVRAGGAVAAVLVLESTRRGDFDDADAERWARAAGALGPRLVAARFRDWHRARTGRDAVLDPGDGAFGRAADDFLAAARARAPVAVTGPAGAGRETAARFLHSAGEARDAAFDVVHAAPDERDLARALGRGGSGTLVLRDVDRWERGAQRALVERLDARTHGGPRLAVLATLALPDAVAAGALAPELGDRLARLELRVPPLCDRRAEIPALARLFAARAAREERLAPLELGEDALAELWRQPWDGQVRQLEHFVFKLALMHGGETVGKERVRALARRFDLDWRARIPSRHPRALDVAAALRTTRTGRGTPNKTRAAAWLGWDPQTLLTKMRALKMDPGTVPDAVTVGS